MLRLFCLLALFIGSPLYSEHLSQEPNVWLITLDGVRWQDVFKDKQIFKNLHKLAEKGLLVGDVSKKDQVLVSNAQYVSLPAYHSIMTGEAQYFQKEACASNECGRVRKETFLERLIREKKWTKNDVAAIATWKRIPLSLEQKAGTIFSNAGQNILDDGSNHEEMSRINREQVKSPSLLWDEARWDRFTHAHSLRYIRSHKPRLMYVAYGDGDLWAHEDDLPNYLATLKRYDQWIGELFELKGSLGDYGKNTTVIITTDHGRGDGPMWKEHGPELPSAKYIWLFASGPKVHTHRAKDAVRIRHIDIRPTIETLLGLEPIDCERCGEPISEIVGKAS